MRGPVMLCNDVRPPINENVLARLLEKAVNMEEATINILLRLFIAEEDPDARKILYELLRDSEYHKTVVVNCLKSLRGGAYPEPMKFKEYEFEDMFYAEKSAILKNVKIVLLDFYRYLLQDVRLARDSGILDKTHTENVCKCLEMLIKEKERHLKLVEDIWNL